MTSHTQAFARRLAQMVMVMTLLITGSLGAWAQGSSSDDINAAILADGSLLPIWTNDGNYPWMVEENTVKASDLDGVNQKSTLKFEYTSDYETKISFEWYRNVSNSNGEECFQVFADGTHKSGTKSSAWSTVTFILPAGSHRIEITNHSGSQGGKEGYNGRIRNLCIWEYRDLHTVALTPRSLPITFDNDPANPWRAEKGYIASSTVDTTSISTTFILERPAKFSCEMGFESSVSYSRIEMLIDGRSYYTHQNTGAYVSVVLEEGTHTITFSRIIVDGNYRNRICRIKNVELYDNWIDVTLPQPGDLGREVLYKVQTLDEVQLLTVRGEMNTDDLATIRQLTNIHGIDMSDASIATIPDGGFQNLSHLSVVKLPEGVNSIGKNAFKGTDAYKYHIPASVESIGDEAFYQTHLHDITFAEGSKLHTIGYQCFYRCEWLREFIMPNSVKKLVRYNNSDRDDYDASTFRYCSELLTLHISDSLDRAYNHMASDCKKLKNVKLPSRAIYIESDAFYETAIENIEFPLSLKSIGSQAFYKTNLREVRLPRYLDNIDYGAFAECKQLRTVTLNSLCWDMNETFRNCTAIDKVVLPSAAPPRIKDNNYSSNAPFSGVSMGQMALEVPDFAQVEYLLDPYWYQFGTIRASEEASVADYWGVRGKLTLDHGYRMRGVPDFELYAGSTVTVRGDEAQELGKVKYWNREDAPTMLLSECGAVTADSVSAYFYMEKNKWYFFCPVADVDIKNVSHSATDSWVIRRYNGERRASQNNTSGNWENVTSGKLLRGQGYIAQANQNGWLTFAVDRANNSQLLGNAEVTLTLNDYPCPDQPANDGWNFLGNPYATYYDIYYMDIQAPITVWTGSTYKALSVDFDSYALRPMQPFFVQKPAEAGNVLMVLNGRQTTATIKHGSGSGKALRSTEGRDLFDLHITLDGDSTSSDMTRVVLNDLASAGYETRYDAAKMMSLCTDVAQIYTLDGQGQMMAINERPYAAGTVGLGVYTPAKGAAYRIEAVRADRDCWLYDAATGAEHLLNGAPYIFIANGEPWSADRFSLRFAPATPLSTDEIGADAVTVTGSCSTIYVTAPEGANVAIYATDGTAVATGTSAGTTANYVVGTSGVYVVTVDGKSFKVAI